MNQKLNKELRGRRVIVTVTGSWVRSQPPFNQVLNRPARAEYGARHL